MILAYALSVPAAFGAFAHLSSAASALDVLKCAGAALVWPLFGLVIVGYILAQGSA